MGEQKRVSASRLWRGLLRRFNGRCCELLQLLMSTVGFTAQLKSYSPFISDSGQRSSAVYLRPPAAELGSGFRASLRITVWGSCYVRQVSCIFAHLHICIFCQIEIHLKFLPETSLRISIMPRVAVKYILYYALEHLIEKLTLTRNHYH